MRNGHFQNYTTADGLSSNRISAVYRDRKDVIWAGTSRGIDRMTGDRFVPLSSTHEIFDPRYISLGEGPFGDLYAFSAPRGISRIDGNRLVEMSSELDLMSIADFQRRDFWFTGGNGIFRVAAADMGKPWQNRDEPLDYASFGQADGLTSTQCSIGAPNMTISRDGKLWIATVKGLALFNLPRLPHTNRRPAIFVEEVTVGREKQPFRQELVLPPGTHHLELKFDSIELSSPEKVRFQYRLDSVDAAWLDADTTRTAVYTDIPVGAHPFHIRACNSDGIWDRTGIVYTVTQLPFFYETNLFRLVGLVFVGLLVAGTYRLRMRQIAAGMNARFDERLEERTRVARDFHDTLLQTIQASKMVADDALDESADPIRMRNALQRLSEWLGRAMKEGRSALNSLRSSTAQGNDLVEALQRAGEECLFEHSIEFDLSVNGTGREMHPIVRDEVYRIGYEAIRNACAHSEASRLSVELSYADDLTLCVRDNGKGVDPDVATKGKTGHFGLIGMYERASRIRGKLTLSSSPGTGTELELVVPCNIAFHQPNPIRPSRFEKIRRLL
jgi:signal transduction histidine kinase